MTGQDTTGHAAKCHRCGRAITSALSIARHYGGGCWAIVRKAARRINDLLAAFTRRQVDQAVELIEDAAIIPGHDGLFYAVSSDGAEVYEVTAAACSCPASRECYHRAAALILAA
jgi:hypothetical protein